MFFSISDAIALQKEREERVRRVREQQEEDRRKKLEELRQHVSQKEPNFYEKCQNWSKLVMGHVYGAQCGNFSVTQILREIKVGESRVHSPAQHSQVL